MSALDKLEGSPIAVMNRLRDDAVLIRNYFHRQSKFMKALDKHIYTEAKPRIIDYPMDVEEAGQEMLLMSYRASSGVRFVDAEVHHQQLDKNNKFYYLDYYTLTISVDFVSRADHSEFPDIHTKQYKFKVPFTLEEDFSEEEFIEWAKGIAEEKLRAKKKEGLNQLKRLLAENPTISGFLHPVLFDKDLAE